MIGARLIPSKRNSKAPRRSRQQVTDFYQKPYDEMHKKLGQNDNVMEIASLLNSLARCLVFM
jgi:hypothetical protein